MTDLGAIEARIWSILAPFRDRLETSTNYKAAFTLPTLDDSLAAQLEGLLARRFDRYEAAHREA